MKLERISNPEAICRDSWWICDRPTFRMRRLLREEVLKAAFGSQPVATIPSAKEQSFMDKKGKP